jgi:Histidine kinase-, DNA gyrase B-, and HSP90-like ATPase
MTAETEAGTSWMFACSDRWDCASRAIGLRQVRTFGGLHEMPCFNIPTPDRLVMNSIESMTTITDRPKVLQIQSRLHDLAGRSAVLVAVRDSGVGLTADGMARVFEAFYSTKPEGMGMGLWICRSIIETHNGQLTAKPNDGVGATFQFVLPLSAEDSA